MTLKAEAEVNAPGWRMQQSAWTIEILKYPTDHKIRQEQVLLGYTLSPRRLKGAAGTEWAINGVAICALLPSFALFVKLKRNLNDSEPDRS
jgi:hypothetical protein